MFSNVEGFITDAEGNLIQSITVYRPRADDSRAWVHIYYNSKTCSVAEERFLKRYRLCYDQMCHGTIDEVNQNFCDEYFTYGYHTQNGRKVMPKKDPQEAFSKRLDGYWCLYTTAEKDAHKAYAAYREWNEIEVLSDDLKNGQDCKRLRVHSQETMRGRLFIQFIAFDISLPV